MAYDAQERKAQWTAKARCKDLAARLSALRPAVANGLLDLDQVEALVKKLEAVGAPTTSEKEGAAQKVKAVKERREDEAVSPWDVIR